MKHTYEERLIAGLANLGWKEDKADRSHYTAFYTPGNHLYKMFVGRNGALRQGECASRSHSIGDASRQKGFYLEVLAAGDAKLQLTDKGMHMDVFSID